MSKHLFRDTLTATAHFYLDENGNEISREEFLEENREWHGLMFYLGGGYSPLQIAVLTTDARGYHQPDEGAAWTAIQEWARRVGRPEEIGEDEDWQQAVAEAEASGEEPPEPEVEMMIERIPAEVEPQEI